MARATSKNGSKPGSGEYLVIDSDESAADTELTLSSSETKPSRLVQVNVVYSASVTKNVTITLNSALGAAYDILLTTLALSGEAFKVYIPAFPIELGAGDVFDVVAEAGGGANTCTLAIHSKVG